MTREQQDEFLAEMGYCAYSKYTGNKNFQGGEMPKWGSLPEKIQGAWCDAAGAIRRRVVQHGMEGCG